MQGWLNNRLTDLPDEAGAEPVLVCRLTGTADQEPPDRRRRRNPGPVQPRHAPSHRIGAPGRRRPRRPRHPLGARRSEEHTSELQSLMRISYAVFCLKKKKQTNMT